MRMKYEQLIDGQTELSFPVCTGDEARSVELYTLGRGFVAMGLMFRGIYNNDCRSTISAMANMKKVSIS